MALPTASDNPFPSILAVETAAASIATPASGRRRLFVDTDHVLKYKDSAGVVTNVGAAAGVSSIAKSGGTALTGVVTLSEGSGVTLTEVGQDIAISSTGGGSGTPTDGWVDDSTETWTYASGSGGGTATFTVPTDLTTKYSKGTRIKLTQTTVKYFVVIASSFGGGNTTVTITGGSDYTLANAAITVNYHSYMANPQGWPGWFNFAAAFGGWSSFTTSIARFAVVGKTCTVSIYVDGTSGLTSASATLPIATTQSFVSFAGYGVNNAANLADPAMAQTGAAPSTAVNFYRDMAGTAWTNSGSKAIIVTLIYEI